ncbi:MAG TPA: helix-turn-helix transcriptional regulator [Thermomicrobiales bacterium]|nr:helix-turn-helix transcriptional regulator [Thermomicrobiales bacterium]
MGDEDRRLGARLREARLAAGKGQREAAAAAGITQRGLSLWEYGQRPVRAVALRRLARLYGKPLAWFFDEEAA